MIKDYPLSRSFPNTKKYIKKLGSILFLFAVSSLFSQEISYEIHPDGAYYREFKQGETPQETRYHIWEPLNLEEPLSAMGAFDNRLSEKPLRMDLKTWEKLVPYLLPNDHPLMAVLDKIFSETTPLSSPEALKKAGFKSVKPNEKELIVASHPKLKGYLIKAYLDGRSLNEPGMFHQRAKGAETLRKSIQEFGHERYMKAPKKWIYFFKNRQESFDPFLRQSILIVEDMFIMDFDANVYAYKHAFHHDLLKAFFEILTKNLLVDSVYIDNVPFSYDFRLAFVDTEHVNVTNYPLKLDKISYRFSEEMRVYWRSLIKEYEHAKKK